MYSVAPAITMSGQGVTAPRLASGTRPARFSSTTNLALNSVEDVAGSATRAPTTAVPSPRDVTAAYWVDTKVSHAVAAW
jgi:hypothetical protein